jgi:hypothetical protein
MVQATQEAEVGGILKASPEKVSMRLCLNNKWKRKNSLVCGPSDQVIEHFPNKYEALSSMSSASRKKNEPVMKIQILDKQLDALF